MKYIFILIPLFQGYLSAQSLESLYSYTESDYYDDNTQTRRASKCDCDFHQQSLTLKKNGHFILVSQEGRLSPETSYEYGTWEKKNNQLILTVTKTKGSTIKISLKGEKLKMEPYTKSFTILDHRISDGYHDWTGRFDPTILIK